MMVLVVGAAFVVYIIGSIWLNGDFKGETLAMCIAIVLIRVLARPILTIVPTRILEALLWIWVKVHRRLSRN